jgi:hypothetical protein
MKKSVKQAKQERKDLLTGRSVDITTEAIHEQTRLGQVRRREVTFEDDDVEVMAADLHRRIVRGETTGKRFIDRKLKESSDREDVLVSGKYLDLEWRKSDFQFQFVDRLRKAHPEIFDELKVLVPNLATAFGQEVELRQILDLFESPHITDSEVSVYEYFERYLLLHHGVRANFPAADDASYGRALRFELLFEALRLHIDSATQDSSLAATGDFSNILRELLQPPISNRDLQFDKSSTSAPPEGVDLMDSAAANWAEAGATVAHNILSNQLPWTIGKELAPDPDRVSAFVSLYSEILRWARKSELRKNWITEYALAFILLAARSDCEFETLYL